MSGKIYVLVEGGVIQEIVTDDPKLINTMIVVADADCDEHAASHLITINRTIYEADVNEWEPQLTRVIVDENPDDGSKIFDGSEDKFIK